MSIFLFSSLILHKWVYFHNNWYQSSRLVDLMEVNASIAKVNVVKFNETSNFGLQKRRMKDMLLQQGLVKALYGKTKKQEKMIDNEQEELEMKAMSTIRICLADEFMNDVMDELIVAIWLKLKSQYMSKSLTNKSNLKWNFMSLRWQMVQI